MSNDWTKYVELREVGGETKAFRLKDGREIPIPKFPQENHHLGEWLANLSLDELEATRQFYMDRWTWETGKFRDRARHDIIEQEVRKRLGMLAKRAQPMQHQNVPGRVTLNLLKRQQQDRHNG